MRGNLTKILGALALAALAYFLFLRWEDIATRVNRDVRGFINTKMDYERLNYDFRPYDRVMEVKDHLPPQARLQISSTIPRLYSIAIRYYFYPCILTDEWDYYIDFAGNGSPPQAAGVLHLPSGTAVYAKDGHAFVKGDHRRHLKLLGMPLLFFAVISAWSTLMGAALLKGIGITPRHGERGWFYSGAYLTGVLVSTGSLWLLMMMGVKCGAETVYAIMAVTTFLALIISRRNASSPPSTVPVTPEAPLKDRALTWALNGAAFIVLGCMTLIIVSLPIKVWDEMLIWIMKARNFYMHPGLDFSYGLNTNNYYPLLWPLHNTFYFFLLTDYDEISKWLSALAYAAFLLQLRSCFLFAGVDRKFAWPLTALYAILFHHWSFRTALPENLLMAFATAMMACALRWIKAPGTALPLLPLAVVMGAGLALVKFEGSTIALLCGVCILTQYRAVPWRPRDILCVVGLCLTPILPWAWLRWVQASGTDVLCYHLHGAFEVKNVMEMASISYTFILENRVLFLLAAVILSLQMAAKRPFTSEEKFLGLMGAGLVVLSFSGGLFWPAEDFQKYYPEVFTRLLVRATPALAVLWVGRVMFRKTANLP